MTISALPGRADGDKGRLPTCYVAEVAIWVVVIIFIVRRRKWGQTMRKLALFASQGGDSVATFAMKGRKRDGDRFLMRRNDYAKVVC